MHRMRFFAEKAGRSIGQIVVPATLIVSNAGINVMTRNASSAHSYENKNSSVDVSEHADRSKKAR